MRKLIILLFYILIAGSVQAETFTVKQVVDGETLLLTNGQTVKLIGVDAPPYFGEVDNDFFYTYDPSDEIREDLEKWNVDIGTLAKMGKEATEFVKGLGVEGKEVRLEFDGQEKNSRGQLLAYVWAIENIPKGVSIVHPYSYYGTTELGDHGGLVVQTFLNASIIKTGYVQPMTIPPNVKYADLFKELYEKARESQKGLWTDALCDDESFLREFNSKPEVIAIPMH